jgi:hypothetical protein
MTLLIALLLPFAQAEPPELNQKLVTALSVRHPAPNCAEAESLSMTPLADLLAVVDQVEMPPWAGMRAAHCIIDGHGVQAEAQLIQWMGKPETAGLAMMVADRLDRLPEGLSERLRKAGRSGQNAARLETRLAK